MNERDTACQAYLNERTPNGNTRGENMEICAGHEEGQRRHIIMQVELAFKAGWHAALKATPPTDT